MTVLLTNYIAGVPGMFRGLAPTMAREMPGYFFFFGGYELAKNFLRGKGEEENIGKTNDLHYFKIVILAS